MVNKTISNIKSYFLSNDVKKIILSISGGADSVFLFHILLYLQKTIPFKIILYHTNYNMNANSSKALYFIKKISRKYDVDFFYDSVNLSTKNFESQARIYRYKKLNHLSQGKKIDLILTAHHFDDQIETLIMKDNDGADWISMLGIRKIFNNIYRPILGLSKKYILQYMSKYNYKWVNDISNDCLDYKRNEIRNKIKSNYYTKSYIDTLLCKHKNSKKMMISFQNKYRNELMKYINSSTSNYILIDSSVLDLLSKIEEFKLFIVKILDTHLSVDDVTNTKSHWINIFKILKESKQGSTIKVFKNIYLLKDRLSFIIYKDSNLDINYKLKFNDTDSLQWYKTYFTISKSKPNNNDCTYLKIPNKYIYNGLYVTHWSHGDKIKVNKQSKKISDLFVNKKISNYNKKYYPIIRDSNNNILWVPGIIEKKYKSYNKNVYIKWRN